MVSSVVMSSVSSETRAVGKLTVCPQLFFNLQHLFNLQNWVACFDAFVHVSPRSQEALQADISSVELDVLIQLILKVQKVSLQC